MEPKKIKPKSLKRVSLKRIKMELDDVSYLSDDLIITCLTPKSNHTAHRPVSINGFAAIIMMSGEAKVSIDMNEHTIRPNDIVFFSPESIIRTLECTEDAAAYLLSSSKKFMNEVQIDLSTSLAIYIRFGRNPIISASPRDVEEIRNLFQLIKTMLASDKIRYINEIIRTLFTTIFYILSELNMREEEVGGSPRVSTTEEVKKGRGEVIFDEFILLLKQYNRRERNVQFYSSKLNISAKYLSSVVKEVSGKTAAKWIDESVILEAKSMLIYSGLTIQEIATELNFSTQSFFGKYFKQHTGISPSRFKRNG
ncbi:MAG: helix-turn-helix domain-containing protein [Rikenellaceae bacterium]